MAHIFVNSGGMSLIISDFERYNGIWNKFEKYPWNFDSGSDEPRYPGSPTFYHIAWTDQDLCCIAYRSQA